MTKVRKWAKAGLVFSEEADFDIVEAANHVVRCFETMGHRVAGLYILSDVSAHVIIDNHDLHIDIKQDVTVPRPIEYAPLFLSLRLRSGGNDRTNRFARDSLLARALQALNTSLQPDFVQWIDTDFLLPSETFTKATLGPNPASLPTGEPRHQTATSCKALPDVEATNAILQDRLSNHDPAIFETQSSPERLRKIFTDGWIDPEEQAAHETLLAMAREMEDIEDEASRRLSAWLLSFAVALFALPVGVALLVLNLAKGENLRLASQAAALTGTFIALQTFGTAANAMTILKNIIT